MLVASDYISDLADPNDDDKQGAKLVYENGFQVRGGDARGNCILSSDQAASWGDINQADIGDPVLLF